MLSSKILDLEERCIRTERDTEAYAPMVAEAFAPQFRKYLTEEEKARFPDIEGYLALVLDVIGVRMVRDVRGDMTVRDRDDRRARKAHHEGCKRRDAAAGGLYDCVVEIRRRCKTHLSPKEEKIYLLGISGETPRQPFMLTRWADALDETLENAAFPIEAKKFDPAPYLRDLREHRAAVNAAIEDVADVFSGNAGDRPPAQAGREALRARPPALLPGRRGPARLREAPGPGPGPARARPPRTSLQGQSRRPTGRGCHR